MIPIHKNRIRLDRRLITSVCLVLCAAASTALGLDDPPPLDHEPLPELLTREAAVAWTLRNNPELAALRQQHGIAAAMVVIAKTYPFNPSWTNKLFAVNGPESSGIQNRVAMEQRVDIDLEIRHQGKYRREAADAGLSRTDWEIAFQEETRALRVVRAFSTVLYQQARFRLGEEGLGLNESAAREVNNRVQSGAPKNPDRILANSEVHTTRVQLDATRSTLHRAMHDLRSAIGVADDQFTVQGTLEKLPPAADTEALLQTALEHRPDLHARQAALAEADARLHLMIADRYGNPRIGPDYEYNETRDNFIGAQIVMPLPIFNRRKGEILQREAERDRAALDLRNTEVVIAQSVRAAVERVRDARAWANYRTQVLPNLQAALKEMEALFNQGLGVDILKVIDIRRKLLLARSGYLDALYEVSQAQADLATAVGDPALALDP